MPKTKNIIDRMNEFLFDEMPKDITNAEKKMVERYRDAYSFWLDNPLSTDLQIRDYLINRYDISKSQAYRDITNIKLLLSNVRSAGKEWHRHRVNYMLEQAAQLALEGNTAKATAISKVATAIIKNNRLDIDEGEQLPFDEIIPPSFEPVNDPTVIGLKAIPHLDERIALIKKKYIEDIDITDVDYKEIISDNGTTAD